MRFDGLTLVTAEQWMMFSKARLFGDGNAAEAILATASPDEQKRFGQMVQGFEQETWDRWKVSLVESRDLSERRSIPGWPSEMLVGKSVQPERLSNITPTQLTSP